MPLSCVAGSESARAPFLDKVVHELRQPLQSIAAALAVIRTAPLSLKQEQAVGIAERQSAQASRLIEDLIDDLRTERSVFHMDHALIDLRDVVRQAVWGFSSAVKRGGLRVRLALGRTPLPVWGDAQRLEQVFGNLLSNAIKFTPRHGTISITVRRVGHSASVCVHNSGPHIDEAILHRMFEPYVGTHVGGGLGLGLTIAREIIEAHGGTIDASRGRSGAGFQVSCPLSAPVHRQLRRGEQD